VRPDTPIRQPLLALATGSCITTNKQRAGCGSSLIAVTGAGWMAAVRSLRIEEGRDSVGQGAGSQPVEATRRKVPQKTNRWLVSVRVKRCGKSAPRCGRPQRQGKPHPEQDQAGRGRPVRGHSRVDRIDGWSSTETLATGSWTESRLQTSPRHPSSRRATRNAGRRWVRRPVRYNT